VWPPGFDRGREPVKAGHRERVAVLCFEAEQSRCHRDIVLDEARRRSTGEND
jgi:uncharacterized protein (DUF488 family)